MFKIQIDKEVHLELVHTYHTEEFLLLSNANKNHIKRWMLWDDERQNSKELKRIIEITLEKYAKGKMVNTFIFYNNKMVGEVGIFEIKGRLLKKAEISYWLDESHQGRGIMRRAVKKIVDIGFKYYALDKITIRCDTENHRSFNIPLKLGFNLDGVLRHDMSINGEKRDLNIYSILVDEWVEK